MLGVNGALTVTNLLGNKLDEESAKILAEVAKQKGISLCGIRRDQTTADFYRQGLDPPDAILLASDLSTVVTGALTSVYVGWKKNITGDAAQELASMVLSKPTLEIFCNIPIKKLRADSLSELDLSGRGVGVPGALVLAKLLPVTGGLTKLSLAHNSLGEEGTKAICKELEQNTTLKELDIGNIGGSAEAKHVAKMVGINGGLTALDLSYNRLEDEGASAVCKAIQNNNETKLASLNFKNNGIGPVGANAVAAMVAVTGALTNVN
jgi:hypothetical protein